MKGIYLGAGEALHLNYDIVYQDINGKRDIGGDMFNINLDPYDFIIVTPPCNFYSRARGNRKPSNYAIKTSHLLTDMIHKLRGYNKPYIIENVRNYKVFNDLGIINLNNVFVYLVGRHTYWTNIMFNCMVPQINDFQIHGKRLNDNTQGGYNVYRVIESWLNEIHNNKYLII